MKSACIVWSRSLTADLQMIVDAGISTLVTLVQPHELVLLGVPELGNRAQQAGVVWLHLPIEDRGAPDAAFEAHWPAAGKQLHQALQAGEAILLHCMGGLGRTGLIAARLLMELDGVSAGAAMRQVRAARPGTIETPAQEAFLVQLETKD